MQMEEVEEESGVLNVTGWGIAQQTVRKVVQRGVLSAIKLDIKQWNALMVVLSVVLSAMS